MGNPAVNRKSRLKNLLTLARRHWAVLGFVTTIILPIILRTGKRPVIFFRWSGIGDILCTFPAVTELMQRHPGCVFIYNCAPGSQCLPRLAGLPVRVTTTPYMEIVHHWYGWLMGQFYQFDYIDRLPNVNSHEILIQEFARPYGVSVGDEHPRLTNDPAARLRMQALLADYGAGQNQPRQPVIVIHPGPSWPVREWPAAAWTALVEKLRQNGYEKIFQLGTNLHANLPAPQAPEIPGVISLVDKLSLEETIALISMADLFIGIDSGLLHVAASVQTPSIGLWGPTAPLLRFSKRNARFFLVGDVACVACHHRQPRLHWVTGCPYDISCMKAISVEAVLAMGLNFLNAKKPV